MQTTTTTTRSRLLHRALLALLLIVTSSTAVIAQETIHQNGKPEGRLISASGTFTVTAIEECHRTIYTIAFEGDTVVGLRSVRLENPNNARILALEPQPLGGAAQATTILVPIDPTRNASADLVVKDREGTVVTTPFRYEAETVDFRPEGELDLGSVEPDVTVQLTVTITNPLDKDVEVVAVELKDKLQGFTITAVSPPVPHTLQSGESIQVMLDAWPKQDDRSYQDSLIAILNCDTLGIKLKMTTGQPAIYAFDVDFGAASVNTKVVGLMKICNQSTAAGESISFVPGPADGSNAFVNEYFFSGGDYFTMSDAEKQRLATTVLAPSECIELTVTFEAPGPGDYYAYARIYDATGNRNLKDTSIWNAKITLPSDVPATTSATTNTLLGTHPDPFTEAASISFDLARPGDVQLEVFNALGDRVALLHRTGLSAGRGEIRFDGSELPSGVYHYRIRSGNWSADGTMVLRR